MAISFGPKLGLLYNALIGESYFDSLRIFLQSIDALVQGSVINATQVSPPTSPNPGDAYLLIGGTPGGAWTGQAGNIAVWDAQLTSSGTNTVVPGWIFLIPKAGWVIWNVAAGNLIVFNGSSWASLTGGANFPTNTNITSMTGIPNTTISTAGYVYSDGTNPQTVIGDAAVGGGATANGLQYGSGTWESSGSTGNVALVGQGPWAGLDASGYGFGVSDAGVAATVMTASGIQSSGTLQGNFLNALTQCASTLFEVGTGGILSFSPNQTVLISAQGLTTNPVSVQIGQNGTPIAGVGMLGFGTAVPTQTTVGAAGGASALPATPSLYLPVVVGSTTYVLPLYAHA